MGIGGWRKSAGGGRLSEVGERWVRGTGVWLVLVPPPLLFSQSSSSRSSQLFLAHYLVRHRRLPGRRREELSSLSLADSRRQSCPALLILINTHFFKPLQHTHTLTHTHSPVSSSDGQVGRRPSLTPALTCKWDVHERQTRDRKSFITHNFVFIKVCHVTNGGRKRSIHVPILLATFLLPLEVSRLTMWTFSICQCWMFSIYHWLNTKSVITGKGRLINIFK